MELFCSHCGAPADYFGGSLDPSKPLGVCRAGRKDHSRVLCLTSREERERFFVGIACNKATVRELRRLRGLDNTYATPAAAPGSR